MKPIRASVLVRESEQAAAESAADLFVCLAMRSVLVRGAFYVALPGGTSPRGLFTKLGGPEWSQHVPWDKTHVFFTDERCVPPDHEDSNYRLASDLLLSRVPIPPGNVHRFATELEPEQAAAAYEAEILALMGPDPHFDLVVLGMGTDTHTASLFPNSPALEETQKLAVANWVEKLSTHRLTLTIPMLNSALSVMVLAFGADKATSVKTALRGELDPKSHPVQAIQPSIGRLLWVLDQPAASLL